MSLTGPPSPRPLVQSSDTVAAWTQSTGVGVGVGVFVRVGVFVTVGEGVKVGAPIPRRA
jgi:hypothetical protein